MTRSTAPETIKFKRRVAKARLNKRTVETLPPPPESKGRPSQQWTYDTETPRLAICTWSSGAKSWYWIGRINGRMARLKLGEYPEITPEQAKKLAAKTSATVAEGVDPRQEKRKASEGMTLAEAYQRYIDDYAKAHKKSWQTDEDLFRRYLEKWKPRRLASIAHADVVSLHNAIGRDHGHYAANRMLSLLSTVYTFASKLRLVSCDNPCRGVTRFAEESRERFLDGDELQRFFEALQEEGELWRDYFIVALLTGGRRGNCMAMKWAELDLDAGTWRIPGKQFKNDQPQAIHLPADVVAILRRRQETTKSEYVFPGRSSGHVNFIYKAWDRICKRANLQGVRPHDLRRTLGSWQAATGASLPIIGKTLGHLNQTTTAIYARLNIDPVRQAVDTAVAAMMTAAKKGETATDASGE